MLKSFFGRPWRRQVLDQGNLDALLTSRIGEDAATRWIAAALAEYNSLRAESLQAQQAQQNIFQFGIAGVAVLTGLGLQNNDELISIVVLLFLVPLLSIFIVSVWFVEIFRSLRAGMFISHMEEKINAVLERNAPALQWESWLRDHREARMFARDRMSFSILFIFNIAGVILAAYLAQRANFHITHPALVVAGFGISSGTLLLASVLTYLRYERRVYNRKINLNSELRSL
jgi:hypothetical protein